MIVVEFFSSSQIENMISTIANKPELVIFVGDYAIMKKYDDIFKKFLCSIGNSVTEIKYINTNIHVLSEIVKTLEKIVLQYPKCHFDLTGGDTLAVTAVGIIYERYKEKGVELHQYNIRTGKVYDCDLNGITAEADIPNITVEQNIILHGGSIVSEAERPDGTHHWDFNNDFLKDINNMWEICKSDCGLWNVQISMLDAMSEFDMSVEDELKLTVNVKVFKEFYNRKGYAVNLKGIFYKLEKAGIISEFSNENCFQFRFKNEQVKRCLTKAGTILELITLLYAREIKNKKGTPFYTDSATGVFIDWDGVIHTEKEVADTENEIDVILMHGSVPIFISCKNGSVDEDELYKLNTVAARFGGIYAKKVLVGTTLGKGNISRMYFNKRADDMDIKIIEKVHLMSHKKFVQELKAIV